MPIAIGNYLKSYQMIIPSQYKDPLVFFNKVKPIIENKIKNELKALSGLKYSIGLEVLLRKDNEKEKPTYTDPPLRFYTEQKAVLKQDRIDIEEQTSIILERIEKFLQNGSGWKVDSSMTLWVDFAEYEPIKGSSYIPLPEALKTKEQLLI